MHETADILIIGGGIIGCLLLYELSKHRLGKVILLERNQLASETTGQSGGFIRKLHLDPALTELASESVHAYQQLFTALNSRCDFINTGITYRFPLSLGTQLQACLARFDADYPLHLTTFPDHLSIHEPAAGCIDAPLLCRLLANAATKNNGWYKENTTVTKILARDNHIHGVETTQGRIQASHVIIAAGASSPSLLHRLGIETHLTLRSFQYQVYAQMAHTLITPQLDYKQEFYAFPLRNGDLIAGWLTEGTIKTDTSPVVFDHHSAQQLHQLLQNTIKEIGKETPYQIKVSHDAFTDDYCGLVVSDQHWQGLHIVSGCSAGGIKIAPALARKMVSLLR